MRRSELALRPWFIWFITTIFFAYQFILRLAPGLIIADIMDKYDIDATEYGFFSAMYYVGYAGMQIPIALLLDRYGPKVIGAIFVCLCAMSSMVFILTDSWEWVLVSRAVLGAGSAAGFLTVSKAISLWFAPRVYGRMVGVSFSAGLIGAVYGGRPVSNLIDSFGWIDVTKAMALVGFIIAILFLIFIPRNKEQFAESEADGKVLDKLKHICTNSRVLWLAFANLMMVGALEGFADVWGVSYLVNVYGYTKSESAALTSLIFVGMIVGAPLLAFLAEKMNANYGFSITSGIFMSLAFFVIILFKNYISIQGLCVLIFSIGVACCYQVLIFTLGSSMVRPAFGGTVVAFLNSINMIGGSLFHTFIGKIMDVFWDGKIKDGIKIYGVDSYNYSLISIPVASLCGAVILFALMVSHKRRVNAKVDPRSVEYH